ncbi:MAG: hypothetical protein A3A33_04345 [Candidatus Yanofskybacteria bacterium RIFCSPLOWO2_01_FULL_49_25]|uniref:Predicted 3'-5' exonuclease PolB-like domain-containing protein n=1 Tax=Candidatus Yanofskybacteria bacterium RIFCSPLOWO2_01_FULL_49_25 TaxID=1802701 RepID=A0A1F8GWA8_9BACT|nr:MAG: hypothetical protein A3A33_04345 [Candidatus Yanofskybacteria bacterium RIFCSPLOWO2_01_FULL_49_25]
MNKLVFDIETIGENYDELDEKTQEILTRWIKKESSNEDDYRIALEELKEGLGFSPLTGEVVAIGVLDVEKDRGVVYYQSPDTPQREEEVDGVKLKVTTEKEMLEKFWEGGKQYHEFISFNGRAFDVPFLMIRSAIHKIRVPINLMPPRFSSSSNHVDLLEQLSFYGAVRRKGNLHMWCRAFGIKSPKADGVSGDDVGELFRNKEFLKIAQYNVGDLKATRELYRYWNEFIRF